MADERQQTPKDGVVAEDDVANGNVPTLALQPVEEGNSWALSAVVAASVLAAGGVLFGVVGCTPRPLTGAIAPMGGDYDRTRSCFKAPATPSAGVESDDAATQKPGDNASPTQ